MHTARYSRLVVHITNIPTPYRIHFCNRLQAALAERGYGFHVLYCGETEPNRGWKIDFSSMQYPYAVMRGVSPRIAGAYLHVNPGVVSWLRRLRPEILLIAGSWNMPTALVASSRSLCGRAFRVFWSEAHAGAILHRAGPVAWLRRRCLRAYPKSPAARNVIQAQAKCSIAR